MRPSSSGATDIKLPPGIIDAEVTGSTRDGQTFATSTRVFNRDPSFYSPGAVRKQEAHSAGPVAERLAFDGRCPGRTSVHPRTILEFARRGAPRTPRLDRSSKSSGESRRSPVPVAARAFPTTSRPA